MPYTANNHRKRKDPDKPQKFDTGRGTPHSDAVTNMVKIYKTKCKELDQMIMQLKVVSDERSVEKIQSEITTKTAELEIKQETRRPHIDNRAVLEHEIAVLHATLAHKENVADVQSQIAKLEMQRAGLVLQTKSRKQSKDVIALDLEISALRKKLASLEMSDTEKTELQNKIDKLTEKLNSSLGSLMQYSDELNTRTLNDIKIAEQTLNLRPFLGKVVGRGQTGKDFLPKDVALRNYNDGCAELQKRIEAGEDPKNLKQIRKRLGLEAWRLEHLYNTTLNQTQMTKLGIVPIWGK